MPSLHEPSPRSAARRIVALTFGLLTLGVLGCQPTTTFNRGVDMSYHPSGKADAQERIVYSAIELKTEQDQDKVKGLGGVYLGELEVVAEKTDDFRTGGGGKALSGRISLEAANRGATHYYLAASSVEHSMESSGGGVSIGLKTNGAQNVQKMKARYTLFRVEQDKWSALPKEYAPETAVKRDGAAASAAPEAKASGGPAK